MRCFSLRVFISSWYLRLSSSSWWRSVMRILNNLSICSCVIDGNISNQYCFSLLSMDSLPSTSSTSSPYWIWISSRIVKVKSSRVIWAINFNKNTLRLYIILSFSQIKICLHLIFRLILRDDSLWFVYMQIIILQILAFIAWLIIKRHRPYIIGVTGTVWKTTITSHVAHFLSKQLDKKNVGYSQYHYNGEYGLPLTIIWLKSPGRNPFGWIWVFLYGIGRLFCSYPKYLVLEYGIDHPWEMDFLLWIATPDIAILTPVESNHIEQFGTLENYRSHKLLLIQSSKHAIVHESLRQYVDMDVLYYSLWALSDIDASHVQIGIDGTTAIVEFNHKKYPISLPAIGIFQIENLLPLYQISHLLGIDPIFIADYTKESSPEPGRSTILKWIHKSTIIDGSYNGWYLSIREWILSMRSFFHSHTVIFFLWDMRELWDMSQDLHQKLAHDIINSIPHDSPVYFYLVWPLMSEFVSPILEKNFPVHTSLSAKKMWQEIAQLLPSLNKDSIIFTKWSQNTIFLEEGVKYFLKDKKDESKLPRQSKDWMIKKDEFFHSHSIKNI